MSSGSTSTTDNLIERVVKERCANLILTGKRANQGNHKKWREYAEGTARELNMIHITSHLDRVKNVSATEAAPIDLFDSDSDKEDNSTSGAGAADDGALSVPSTATAISLFFSSCFQENI